jgi:hypothetical protein
MIDALYQKMAIPDACHLGKRVFKTLFHENAVLGATDKKAFREDIDTVTWEYTLKPATIPIPAYEDDKREYVEVALLQVNVHTPQRIGRIAEVIQRAIPYPLIVVFSLETKCALNVAQKRFSQAERGAIVAEDIRTTRWIDLEAPSALEEEFLCSLAVPTLPHTNFYAFYSAIVDRCIALECARFTGKYCPGVVPEEREVRLGRLAASRALEDRIAERKAAIRTETQFNRQVELNAEIKRLEQELRQVAASL